MSIAIAVAPVTEQLAIVQHYTEQAQPIIATIKTTEREIDLLREYRTRLITDVVTGKLDVREAAARLPEVERAPADEPEVAEMEETIDDLAGEVV